jgi:oxygen-independent coproporphyrinogen-3 oxidase
MIAPASPVYFEVLPRHLYVHVPFCARRCSYCDFSIAVRRETPVEEYLAALDAELRLRFPANAHWTLDTLYLGGGTPSRLGADGVARLIDLVRQHATLAPSAEVTIEANPDDVDASATRAWQRAGVNRLSLGVQSFDARALAWMHRLHSPEAGAAALHTARDAGIEDVSIDLIFALPAALEREWSRDLDLALALEPSHLSLYGLTVETHTPLGRWAARGDVIESPEEAYESEFLEADRRLTAAGLEHYEVSNFGRPGARSRHNSSYWSGVPYAGIGPAAHEYDGIRRRWNVAPYAAWARHLASGVDPIGGDETLTEENRLAERVYLGLRTPDGLALSTEEGSRVHPWIDAGWATLDRNLLRLTPLGWLRLDALATDLTVIRSR